MRHPLLGIAALLLPAGGALAQTASAPSGSPASPATRYGPPAPTATPGPRPSHTASTGAPDPAPGGPRHHHRGHGYAGIDAG